MLSKKLDESLIAQLFDNQPDGVFWFKPIAGPDQNVIDFKIGYVNNAAAKMLGVSKNELEGVTVKAISVLDKDLKNQIFDQCIKVWNTGEPLDFTYYSPLFDSNFNVQRSRVMDGILSITRDKTHIVRTETEKEKQAQLLNNLLNSSPYGVCLYQSIRDEKGVITDFRLKLANRKSSEITALTMDQLYNNTVRQLMELRGHSDYFEICSNVVESGQPYYMEYYSKERKQWLGFSLIKFEDGYLVNYIDITETKKFEQEAKLQAEKLENILNASLSGVFACEAIRKDGKIVDLRYENINEMYTKMIGRSKEEVIGRTMLELYPMTLDNGVFQTHCNVIETGVTARFEIYYQGDGLDAWFDISSVKSGENSVVVTFVDVLEQKKALQEIERQKTLLNNILKYSFSGISVTEMIRNEKKEIIDARQIIVNDAAADFSGIDKEQMTQKTLSEIDPAVLDTPLFKMAIETLKTGQPFVTQYFVTPTNRWLEISVSKMDNDHLINIFTDITKSKEGQLNLEKTVEELKKSNSSLEEFAYAASHDMKEPIRKIQYFSDRLKAKLGNKLDEEETAMFQRMQSAATRMQLLIDDLLTYSQVSIKPRETESIDLNIKIQKILEDLEIPVQEKEAKVNVGTLPVIKGYRLQIQQLFQNLIGNALKYSKRGIRPEINIRSKIVPNSELPAPLKKVDSKLNYHLIEVSDNGIGFEQKDAERIFQMFQRLHGNNEYKGTGVGLSIARKVIENHDGYIVAESEPEVGSVFKIYLPA